MNNLPGLMTLVACWSRPTKDRISCFVALFLPNQLAISWWILCNFSSGSQISDFKVSMTTPRNVREVEGPFNLSSANGIPSSLHVCMNIIQILLTNTETSRSYCQKIIQVMDGE